MSTLASVILKGLAAGMPAASIPGRLYFSTDTQKVWYDTGSGWSDVSPASLANPMTTQGDLIVGGAAGAPGRLASGALGYILTSNGAGAVPSWQAAPTGGGGGGSSVSAGTFASLPVSPSTGQLFIFTDSIYDCAFYNGANWLYFARGKSLTPPNEASFSWQNQTTATLTTTQGGSRIASAVGAGGSNINGRYIAYPGTPFTLTLAAQISARQYNVNPSSNGAGLYLSDGAQALVYGVSPGISGSGFSPLVYQSGPTLVNISANVFSAVAYTGLGLVDGFFWLRMDDGVTASGKRTWWISYNGIVWVQVYRIGYYTGPNASGTQLDMWVAHWLKT